jgi:hypothetical protein
MGTRTSTESDRVTPAVLEALEEVTGTDRLELPPLYETIDTDALDRLFASLSGADDVEPATFQFTYAGHRVTVTADGDVTVSPTE